MYKCESCNSYFDEPKAVRGDYHPETTPPSYESYIGICPLCGGENYEEVLYG